jgi:hypothetical protein
MKTASDIRIIAWVSSLDKRIALVGGPELPHSRHQYQGQGWDVSSRTQQALAW